MADPGISKRGRCPGAVELLGIGFVLMPLHTYSVFVARVVNKIHNINTVYFKKKKKKKKKKNKN